MDSGRLWKQLGSLGYSKKSGGEGSIVLMSDGSKFFSLTDVSRVFNEFYTTVAAKLVERLPSPSRLFGPSSSLFSEFYRRCRRGRSFTLMPVSGRFIREELSGMKTDKGLARFL